MQYKWVPNAMSFTRVFLAPIIVVTAMYNCWVWSFCLLIAALLSDYLDGWLAIKLNAKSKIGGQYIDPLCDLIMIIGAITGLTVTKIIPIVWVLWILVICLPFWILFYITKESALHYLFDSINAFGYIISNIIITLIYARKALAVTLFYIIIIAIPALCTIAKLKENRLKYWSENIIKYFRSN